jgi:hypothetical protein
MRLQLKHRVTCVYIGLAALMVGTAVSAQTTEPLVGNWKLDVAKSSYKPGPAPKSVTVAVEPAGKGLKISVDAVTADGTPMKWGFTTQRDGKDVPVTGNPNYDTAATTQASPHSGTTLYKKDGKLVVTSKAEVSKDGKTLTITGTGTDAKGQAIHNVSVYTKQ